MTMVGSRTMLSRSHVSSMTLSDILAGSCWLAKGSVIILCKLAKLIKKVYQADPACPIYYQGVVSAEKGRVIIR